MALADLEIKDDIAFLRLNNGVTNAISPELIADISIIIDRVKNEASAMILTGNDRFFSIGFDLPKIMGLDRSGLGTFLYDFQTMIFHIATLPLPVIAAQTGHAVAGGAILAIVCDYRIGKSDKLRIGFNESLLGLTIPWLAELMLNHFVGLRVSQRLRVEGSLIKAEDAVPMGLMDEACALDTIPDCSLQKIRQLQEIPLKTFAAIKENQLQPILESYLARVKPKTEQFMDLWFSKEAQKRLGMAMEKF